MKTILIATTNPGKADEIRVFLSDLPVRTVSLSEAGIESRAPESGETFEENARMKARFYSDISGLPALADDGGFEIDALGGDPGVRSRRWVDVPPGKDEDEAIIDHTMRRMEGVPEKNRTARLTTVVAFSVPGGLMYTQTESVSGIIPFSPSSRRTKGFPYRSLLFLPELRKFYDRSELTEEETEKYNHRKKAVERLKPTIRKEVM